MSARRDLILMSLLLREGRIQTQVFKDWKREYGEQSDELPSIPKSASFSGWMRNGREAYEMDHGPVKNMLDSFE